MKLKLIGLLFTGMLFPIFAFSQVHVGDWKMEYPNEAGEMQVFKLTITADGNHAVDFGIDGTIDVKGKHTIEGNTMTIWDTEGEMACPSDQKGIYTFSATSTTLTMTQVSEDCEQRGSPNGPMVFTKM